uniref:Uncharacterized protein n=1 Tax=Anguilla anguilla TaxID=7936 RepID=A0A0E9WHM0_ANGAN
MERADWLLELERGKLIGMCELERQHWVDVSTWHTRTKN